MQLRQPFFVRRWFATLSLALLVLAPLGCGGGGTSSVSGKVTIDEKPLSAGQIVFIPANGPPVSAPLKNDGTYTAMGVPRGDVKVTVDNEAVKRQIDQAKQAKGFGGPKDQSLVGPAAGASNPQMPPEAKEFFAKQKQLAAEAAQAVKELTENYRHIPDRYRDAATSGLTLNVKSGDNSFDVPLKSK